MAERSRTEYSIINIFASMGGYALNILLSFICRVVFVRCLNAEYLGINGMFSNILSMLSLTELGIGTAMIYALYKPVAENDKSKIASYMRIYGIAYKVVGCVVALLGVLFIPFLDLIINEPDNIPEDIYVLYLLFLFSTASSYFYSYRSSILIANQRNYIVLAISYAMVVIQNAVQIIVLIITKNYVLYLIVQVAFVLITNILISQKAVRDYPYIKDKEASVLAREEVRGLMKNIKALTVTKLSGILVNNTDNIVITYFNGLVTTGVVSNYSLFTSMLNSLVNQMFTGLSASLGNLNAVGDKERKYKVFKSLNLANFWAYGWATIGIIVLSNDLVEFCFGKEYVMDTGIPIILAINFYMLGMQCVVGMYKSTMGLFKQGQYILFVTAILNLVGDVILGKTYGVMGIFMATALARLITNTWYEPYVVYKFGLKQDFKKYIFRYVFFIITLVLATSICYGLCALIRLPVIWRLTIRLLICITIPNAMFFLIFYKWDEFELFIDLIKQVKNKFSKKH